MQEPKPRKTIHVGYLIAIVILVIAAVVLAIVFWPSKESEAPTPPPTVPPTATTVVLPTATPVTKATVSIVAPAIVVKSAGRDFHVLVNISTISNLAAAQYDIQYDPKVIKIESIAQGNIGGSILPIKSWSFIPASTQGTVRIINSDPSLAGINGAGYLSDITFRVFGDPGDSCTISFIQTATDPQSNLRLGQKQGVDSEEIPSSWVNASVTIQ